MTTKQKQLLENMQKRLEYCKQIYNQNSLDPVQIQHAMEYILEQLDINAVLCSLCLESKNTNKGIIHSTAFALYCKDRKNINYTKLKIKKDYKESLKQYIFQTVNDIKELRNQFQKTGYDFKHLNTITSTKEMLFNLGHLQAIETRLVWCCLAYFDIFPSNWVVYDISLFQTQTKLGIYNVIHNVKIIINEELKTLKLQKV